MNPPIPGQEQNLEIVWNPDFPPVVGEKVKYVCSAGGQFNRREDNINLADYYLECLDGGIFETPIW